MTPFRSAGIRLCVAGLAACVGLAGLFGKPTRAGEGQEIDSKPRLVYEFSEIKQFGLAVLDAEDKDKKKDITLSPKGSTNTTVVRIDGKDFEFGTKEGKFQDAKGVGKGKKGETSVWTHGDIQVKQTLEVVPSLKAVNGKRRRDTALITWTIKNKGDKAHEVGLRCVIDTAVGGYDGNPFVIAGKEDALVTTNADFKGADVPKYVKALAEEDLKKPGFTAYLTLKVGGDVQPPDRFSITTWPGTAFREWEVPVKNIMGDSAVVLYWNPTMLEAGATSRRLGFACGGGEVSLGEPKDESKD